MKPLTLTFFIAAGLLLAGCGSPSAEMSAESTSTTIAPTQPPPTDPPPTATEASLVSAEPATPTPLATEVAAASPTDEPMPTEAPTVSAEVVEVVSGQLPSGAFFLGDLDAAVTLIDYSDFL